MITINLLKIALFIVKTWATISAVSLTMYLMASEQKTGWIWHEIEMITAEINKAMLFAAWIMIMCVVLYLVWIL